VAHLVAARREVVAERGDNGGRHVEAIGRGGQRLAPGPVPVARAPQVRQQPIRDLGRQRRVPRSERGDEDRRLRRGRQRRAQRAAEPGSRPRPGRGRCRSHPRAGPLPRRRAPGAGRRRSRGWRPTGGGRARRANPSTTCGPDTPSPSSSRPPDSCCSVAAVMAVAAGVLAAICAIAVPSRSREVVAAMKPSGVNASAPHPSAVQSESWPRDSASLAVRPRSSGASRRPIVLNPRCTVPSGRWTALGSPGRVAQQHGRREPGVGVRRAQPRAERRDQCR
jgi:hypothetical protein